MVTAGVTLFKMPLTGLFSNCASGAFLPSRTWRNPVHARKMAPKTGADQERWPWQSDGCSRNHNKPMAPKHIPNLASAVFQAAIATAQIRTMGITGGEASRGGSPSSGQQPPHLACTADRGSSPLLPAAGTIARTTESCTKRSHCNRFDACMAPWVALASAPASSAPAWAAVPESAEVLESVQPLSALEWVRRAEP